MKLNSLLLLLIFSTFLVSCAEKSSSSKKKTTRIDPVLVENLMSNQFMSCDSVDGRENCPEGMARLLILNPRDINKSGVCSGFMVNSTTMVTNHHCIENQTVCNTTYVAVYRKDGTYLRTKCSRVIVSKEDASESNDPTRAQDFAVVKLADYYDGEYFSVSNSVARPGDSVTAWVIDHTGLDREENANLFESRVTEFNCEVKDQSRLASKVLISCPIISGNSGSPVVNEFGEVVGVIWGGYSSPGIDADTYLGFRRSYPLEALMTDAYHFRNYIWR